MNAAQQVCQSAAAAAAEPKHPSPRKRKHLHRVQFAEGPLKQVYGTQDGHPDHEGLTARAVRDNGASWPLDLTAHNVRMLEVELGEACRPSLDRLKRRVGLLPAVKRQRIHVTPNNRSPATERRTSQSVLRALKTDTV
ncbi:hypothetical protein WJX72_010863 [[Myrmecia] bisecta]|uniref:Uncharacterized protein n=1 Tax=[Myrmecia] bisecta TaxID=41462 RepID=A0AAW1R9H0_9CHLO